MAATGTAPRRNHRLRGELRVLLLEALGGAGALLGLYWSYQRPAPHATRCRFHHHVIDQRCVNHNLGGTILHYLWPAALGAGVFGTVAILLGLVLPGLRR